MDDYFSNDQPEIVQPVAYNPPQLQEINLQPAQQAAPVFAMSSESTPVVDFTSYSASQPVAPVYQADLGDNEFNDFEQDQMTRRIRQQQERIQAELRTKSNQEYEQKNARKAEGKRQFDQFVSRKEKEKQDRAAENIKKEEQLREEYRKLSEEAGWKKVISNVNLKQGEYKGKKDINRMRESILHKREDDA